MKKIILFASIILTSCSGPQIYSPYLHATASPMQKDQGQLIGAAGLLPKTHIDTEPGSISGSAVSRFGGELALRYAFTDRLTLQAKAWHDLSQAHVSLGGFSFSGIYRFDTARGGLRWALVPQFGIVYDGNAIQGRGAAISALAWLPRFGPAQPYLAFGPMIGTRQWDFENYEWGWGLLGNIGAGFELPANFTATIEVATAFQADQYEKKNFFILAPSIGIGWRFENR